MDTPKESYNNDILVVYRALERAGLKSSIQLDSPRRTDINSRKRFRKTKSFSVTKYCCLVPYFGLSKAQAAKKLGLKPGAFRDLCRNVGIPVWPWIPNTAARDSSVPETQINQTVAESRTNEIAYESSDIEAWIESECARPSFMPDIDEMDFSDLCRNVEIPVGPWMPDTTARASSLPEAQINQAVAELTNEIAFQTSDIEAWIESERARPGFVPDLDEMDYQDKNDPFIDGLDFMDCPDYNIEELIDQIE
ncbi:uncharacterized protein LOC143539372 [Bidens hawaiensis]|uniref:uncharacterized protein LOC143539372 n=1 Tax=Bidens hawaiensis TaxID=980011 RepID=UPI00404A1BC1